MHSRSVNLNLKQLLERLLQTMAIRGPGGIRVCATRVSISKVHQNAPYNGEANFDTKRTPHWEQSIVYFHWERFVWMNSVCTTHSLVCIWLAYPVFILDDS